MVATNEMMQRQRPDGMDPETGVWQKISLGLFLNIQFHIGIVTQITSHLFDISTLVLKKVSYRNINSRENVILFLTNVFAIRFVSTHIKL